MPIWKMIEVSRGKMADNTRFMAKVTRRESARPMYAAVVDGMDQSIGRVDTLDSEGLTDNTIVLFFSDNGGAVYAIGGADNAPLRGGKGDTFEGGIRVVATMRWPEKIAPGGKVDLDNVGDGRFPHCWPLRGLSLRRATALTDVIYSRPLLMVKTLRARIFCSSSPSRPLKTPLTSPHLTTSGSWSSASRQGLHRLRSAIFFSISMQTQMSTRT